MEKCRMMSGRESGRYDPYTKSTVDSPAPSFLSGRRCNITLMKSVVTVCLILTISLVLYAALSHPIPSSNSTRWWISYSGAGAAARHEESSWPTTLSHIVFGLAGSAATWSSRRHYSELWWSPNITRGCVWLDESPNYTWPATSPPYRVSPTRDRHASDRIARILKWSLEAEDARWFVMGDDDTVFFKENLAALLARYDHREMWYIGGVSESVEQNMMHSYRTAFGGGGFAISYALASRLASVMDGCVKRYKSFYGSDEKVSACVEELGVPLTTQPGFHQLDIKDDSYGFLAAHPIAPLLSLHHLDYIKPLFPNQTQLESLKTLTGAYKIDPTRTMQQSICYSRYYKWSFSVSWGYTIQLYPSLLPLRELELPLRTFTTWHTKSAGPFVFNTRELNPNPCDQPIVYFLDRVVEADDGNSTVSMFKRMDQVAWKDGKVCETSAYKYAMSVEIITVLAPKMDPQDLIKAPRRQCCEMRSGWSVKRSIQITIKSCKLDETITA